jgi:hypothetical protein
VRASGSLLLLAELGHNPQEQVSRSQTRSLLGSRARNLPMLDDADHDAREIDPPDAGAVYARYLETCRRLSVEPVPRERAHEPHSTMVHG